MTAPIPAPTYVLAHAAWIPTLVLWHADGRFTRLEGASCEDDAAALAASWRPIRPRSNCPSPDALGILPSAMVMPILIVNDWLTVLVDARGRLHAGGHAGDTQLRDGQP